MNEPNHISPLTPTQLGILEVFRRLQRESLPDPTIDTVVQLMDNVKKVAVEVACEQLCGLGYLERGGRSKRSYKLTDPPQPVESASTGAGSAGSANDAA